MTTNALFNLFLSRRSPPRAMLESNTGVCNLLTRINFPIARVDTGVPLPRGAASHFFHTQKVIFFPSFLHLFWCSIRAVHRVASAIFAQHDFWSNKRFPVQPWNFLFQLLSRRRPYGRPGRRVVPGLYQEPEKPGSRISAVRTSLETIICAFES